MSSHNAKFKLLEWHKRNGTAHYAELAQMEANEESGSFTPSTITQYKYALSWWHKQNKLPNPCIGNKIVEDALKRIVASGQDRVRPYMCDCILLRADSRVEQLKRVAVVLQKAHFLRIMEELDLTTADGLFYATMFGLGITLCLRPGELVYLDKQDITIKHSGVEVTIPFSKTDQQSVGVKRGVQHRDGCSRRAPENDGAATFCVACCVKKYLDLTGDKGVMFPAFSGEGSVTKQSITSRLRAVVEKINGSSRPFLDETAGVAVTLSLKNLSGASFRRTGCQWFLGCEGASTAGAMHHGRWRDARVFDRYAHNLTNPLGDPHNVTRRMLEEPRGGCGDAAGCGGERCR